MSELDVHYGCRVSPCGECASAKAAYDDEMDLREENARLRSELVTARETVDAYAASAAESTVVLAALSRESTERAERIAALEAELAAANEMLRYVVSQLAQIDSDPAAPIEELARRAVRIVRKLRNNATAG